MDRLTKIVFLIVLINLFTQFAYASGVMVSWVESSASNVAGYLVYYGTASHKYTSDVNAGTFTSVAIDGLTAGVTYYFAVTAYDNSGNQSAYSQEVQVTISAAVTVNTGSGSGSSSSSSSGSISSSGSSSNSSSGSSSSSATESGSGVGTESSTFTLNASVVNDYGTITFTPSTGSYAQGTIVSLTATPDEGYQVKAWTGTDNDTSKNNSNTVTMNANRIVSVEFEAVSNAEENNDGGGKDDGLCFISTSVSESPVSQRATVLVLIGIVLMGTASFLRKYTNN